MFDFESRVHHHCPVHGGPLPFPCCIYSFTRASLEARQAAVAAAQRVEAAQRVAEWEVSRHAAFLRRNTSPGAQCPCIHCSPLRGSQKAMPVRGREGAVAATTSGLQSAVSAPLTLDDEITELLADVPEPSESGLLSPAALDAAFDIAVACSATEEELSVVPCPPAPAVPPTAAAAPLLAVPPTAFVAPCQPCQPVDEGITELHSATPRGRGESIKRRKRSRKPGDQRLKS